MKQSAQRQEGRLGRRLIRWPRVIVAALLLTGSVASRAEHVGGPNGVFRTDVPPHPFSLILGRPTVDSVTVSVMTPSNVAGFIRYGREGSPCTNTTPAAEIQAGQPTNVILTSLAGNARYHYRFCYRATASETFADSNAYTFHTQRPAGNPFTFTVTADSHLDENTDPAIYAATLRRASADQPDFHIDLGDTFMTGKRRDRPGDALPQYLAQRYYFGLLCHSAPLFLVLGNHDGECGGNMREATGMRTRYFPNPCPGVCYTGSPDGNYYAWRWGDALFVVLDPFRYSGRSQRGPSTDNWGLTLGRDQYDWLRATLENSSDRFKFVFIHHLVGGSDRQGRGGAEAVPFFEWGGHEWDGRDTFAAQRAGWPMPVHALLVRHGVTAVFHGHDHFFARQEVDGIVYQLVPQPGHPGEGSVSQAASYGYRSGTIQPGTGYLRVSLDSAGADVAYVRTETGCPLSDDSVVYRYRMSARTKGAAP